MSNTYLRLIPDDPTYVPRAGALDEACRELARAAPDAEGVTTLVSDEPRFVDSGPNPERITCPRCGAELGCDWWSGALAASGSDGADLRVTVPCCGARLSLNELVYDLPAGFARFVLEALNPNLVALPQPELQRLGAILGTSLRPIWATH